MAPQANTEIACSEAVHASSNPLARTPARTPQLRARAEAAMLLTRIAAAASRDVQARQNAEDERAIANHPSLSHLKRGEDPAKVLAGANIRRDLTKHWPAVQFYVKRNGPGIIQVRWLDGPASTLVEDVLAKFAAPPPSVFGRLFGHVERIEFHRSHSDPLMRRAIVLAWARFGFGSKHQWSVPTVDRLVSAYSAVYLPEHAASVHDMVTRIAEELTG